MLKILNEPWNPHQACKGNAFVVLTDNRCTSFLFSEAFVPELSVPIATGAVGRTLIGTAVPMVTMGQSAANWRNTHTHETETKTLRRRSAAAYV